MIEVIKINIVNDFICNDYLINVKDLCCIYNNNKIKYITLEKINELLSIIKLWDNEYLGNIIDGEEFLIEVVNHHEKTIFHGKGKYPVNYDLFKEWIRSL